jgi:hypothetical protein
MDECQGIMCRKFTTLLYNFESTLGSRAGYPQVSKIHYIKHMMGLIFNYTSWLIQQNIKFIK